MGPESRCWTSVASTAAEDGLFVAKAQITFWTVSVFFYTISQTIRADEFRLIRTGTVNASVTFVPVSWIGCQLQVEALKKKIRTSNLEGCFEATRGGLL